LIFVAYGGGHMQAATGRCRRAVSDFVEVFVDSQRRRRGHRPAMVGVGVALVAGIVVAALLVGYLGRGSGPHQASGPGATASATAQAASSRLPTTPPASVSTAPPAAPGSPAGHGASTTTRRTGGATSPAAHSTTTAPAPAGGTGGGGATAGSGVAWDSITGDGCTQNDSQGFYTTGRDLSGWVTATSGGFGSATTPAYGCTGRYDSMPLTGTNQHSNSRYLVWWFATSVVSSASCELWIYVPTAANPADTASTAHFAVLPSKDSWDTIATFSIDESAAVGTWAYAGAFPMTSGQMAVKLTDQGVGRASAAAALVKCFLA
jgi:hypothetical protein